jgi:hypothetical protein
MRLTNEIRSAIIEATLLHRFEKVLLSDAALRADTAYRIWKSVMTPTGLAKLESVPEGWLPTKHTICVRLLPDDVPSNKAVYYELPFSGNHAHISQGILPGGYKGRPHKSYVAPDNWPPTHTINDPDFIQQVMDVIEFTSDRIKQIKEAREALGVVNEFTTSEKLLMAWPELEPFVTPNLPAPKPQLPALQTDRLNTLLGLPVD